MFFYKLSIESGGFVVSLRSDKRSLFGSIDSNSDHAWGERDALYTQDEGRQA